ncbi:TetR/AcrR family transcriptional regulator [Bradyrhizobium cajani]|uniref:TetR family transcriptional regulator n=1 Tax=Bradyrhizobium cajani TaxID=1928661 RepID=A0A844TJ36_9BRAD|nr:TetR/AcrR family transcriptional regulator [Bradyrhizobium cajani]MCP3368180.1 TetR/AcrR family transcriptional regulator [Bradyrhizobium cajani]MVT76729.1 TetR family transcriptional regulator [Bradyrhizobium cajani]
MARPLSEQKREAILAAAAELVAAVGTGASTANIAKAARVSEGTLFTYFATKDELLNQLFVDIETNLAETVFAAVSTNADSHDRVRRIWDCLVEWGIANPTWRKALRQLKVSDRISDESRKRCDALFGESREMIERSLAGHVDPKRAAFYIGTVLMGLADVTIEAIATNPKNREHLKRAGFDLFWKGTAA